MEGCCERGSALACEAKRLGIPYMGITQDMESESTQTAVSQYLNQYRDPKKVSVHVSSPCASGSPLRHCKGNIEPTSADFDWDRISPHVGFYVKLGDCSSFELPWRNEIWNRYLTKETLNKRTLISMCKSTYVQLVFEQLLEKRLVRVWGSPPTLVRL